MLVPALSVLYMTAKVSTMVMTNIQQYFPNPTEERAFVAKTASTLATLGFNSENTLPVISVCRDEICSSFINAIETRWGKSFSLGGLAGLPFGGKMEMSVAHDHAPDIHDRKRLVIYGMVHIGFGPQGEVGGCVRPGMKELNRACGALIAYSGYTKEEDKELNKIFTDDGEYGLLIYRMEKAIKPGDNNLLEVTNAALEVIQQDIDRLTSKVIDPDETDYAVFTGTQIHLPDGNYVQAADSWVVMNSQRQDINFNS